MPDPNTPQRFRIVCRKCGRDRDLMSPRMKYCGNGSDKDNEHDWQEATLPNDEPPSQPEGNEVELENKMNAMTRIAPSCPPPDELERLYKAKSLLNGDQDDFDRWTDAINLAFPALLAEQRVAREKLDDLDRLCNQQHVLLKASEHKEWPVWQACETCAPAALDETGKCPKCGQVYDFSRWKKLSSELAASHEQLRVAQEKLKIPHPARDFVNECNALLAAKDRALAAAQEREKVLREAIEKFLCLNDYYCEVRKLHILRAALSTNSTEGGA